MLGGLAVVSLALILIAGAIVSIGGRVLGPLVDGQQETLSFVEAAWMSLMRTFDAGTMGGEIAQVISFSGLPVVMKDVDQAMLDKGMETIRHIYQSRVDKGKMSAGEMSPKGCGAFWRY